MISVVHTKQRYVEFLILRRLVDVRGSQEMAKNLNLKVSNNRTGKSEAYGALIHFIK